MISEFELHLRYYGHFRTNTFGKGMKFLIVSSYGLNSATTVLQRWFWQWITHKGWFAIKKINQANPKQEDGWMRMYRKYKYWISLRTVLLVGLWIRWVYPLWRGKTPNSPQKKCPGYDSKLHLMWRLLFWRFGFFIFLSTKIPLMRPFSVKSSDSASLIVSRSVGKCTKFYLFMNTVKIRFELWHVKIFVTGIETLRKFPGAMECKILEFIVINSLPWAGILTY